MAKGIRNADLLRSPPDQRWLGLWGRCDIGGVFLEGLAVPIKVFCLLVQGGCSRVMTLCVRYSIYTYEVRQYDR